jgi:eukaryotic-like serine/threonine-protein kinase
VRLTPGSRLGPYEVLSILGTGGMAEVYRARDSRLGRDVALKVVNKALASDPELVRRFEQEARLAGSLNHPNLVAVYDVGVEDGAAYFITELLRGESLRERLARGRIPLPTALDWAAQLSQGLAAAHAQGIIHRDVKPENVFVTSDGHVKLLDFGIAKLAEGPRAEGHHGMLDDTLTPSGSKTRTGAILGTPAYMSPEQIRGEQVDARTDIFSLGAVLHEMLSGQRPFPGSSVVESGHAILHDEPLPLPDALPSAVAQVVHRCLEKEPSRRVQSAQDLAFDLDLLGAPTNKGTGAHTGRGAARSRRFHWALTLLGVLASLVIGAVTYVLGRNTRPPMPSVEQITFRLGRITAGRFTPEGRVVFSAAWDGRPLEVFARAGGSPDVQSLVHDASLLGVSAGGELAISVHAFWSLEEGELGTLAVVSGAGGAPREVAERVLFADWSPTNELAAVRSTGGKRQLEYPLGTTLFETAGLIKQPRVSPNGDEVAFLHEPRSRADELVLVDRRGRVRTLCTLSPKESGWGLAWVPSGKEVWFTTHDAIWASPLSGGRRLVYQGVSELSLQDISRSGLVLINVQNRRREVAFLSPGVGPERRLSLLGYTALDAISDDGRQVLLTSGSDRASFFTYLRPTDGAPAVRLGPGWGLGFSPDGKRVLVRPDDYATGLTIFPVGPGAPWALPLVGVKALMARWLWDGKRIALMGLPSGETQFRLFVAPLDGGVPALVSPEPLNPIFMEVSRDDSLVAARTVENVLTLYPLDGGTPIPLPDLGPDAAPIGWPSGSQLWVKSIGAVPARISRYDVHERRVLEDRIVSPSDMTGVLSVPWVRISGDGRTMAFDYQRILGNLYLLDGLPSAKH